MTKFALNLGLEVNFNAQVLNKCSGSWSCSESRFPKSLVTCPPNSALFLNSFGILSEVQQNVSPRLCSWPLLISLPKLDFPCTSC
jgi:hypothetical protein